MKGLNLAPIRKAQKGQKGRKGQNLKKPANKKRQIIIRCCGIKKCVSKYKKRPIKKKKKRPPNFSNRTEVIDTDEEAVRF